MKKSKVAKKSKAVESAVTNDFEVEREAELQARLTQRIREALPMLPGELKLERHLRLRLGHHEILIDGAATDHTSVRGRYDLLLSVGSTPLLLVELKAPGVAVVAPRRPMLQQYPDHAVVVDRVQQQPGRTVATPVPMAALAPRPSVAVPLHSP